MELGFIRKKKFVDNKDSSFVDQVFSWIVPDIVDDSLFINKTLNVVGRLGNLYGPFCFIDISEGKEEVDDDNFGRRNLVEVAAVIKIVQRLYEEWRYCSRTLHVVVTSPYVAQVIEIERRLTEAYGCFSNFVLKVKTFDGFQDDKADVVIMSTVNSSFTESAESDYRRTNVVFAKARHCLWILGRADVLSKANRLWDAVISNAKMSECFVNANEDEELAKVIADVKSQLNELEDLLNMKSLIFKDARWKVKFSETFIKSFSKLPSTYSKKVVLGFLLKLANGWRPKKYNSDAVSASSMNIVKKFRVENWFIICTNDIAKESGYATQVLKVWDILYLVDVPAMVKKLENIYRPFSNDHLRRCKEKCLEGSLEVPRQYSSFCVSWDECLRINEANNVENSKVKESLLLMKFYSFSAGVVSHLLSARDGTPINLPFEMTDQEQEIILHKRSSFVLGRSGTGKTTVLVMKLFRKEQLSLMASTGFSELNCNAIASCPSVFETYTSGASLRQIFLTVNPKLCIAVKRHISNFQRFVRGDTFGEEKITIDVNDMDEYEIFKDVPTSLVETPLKAFPLVMTFNTFLLLLDRTIGTSYFSRFPEIREIYSQENPNFRPIHLNLVKRREVSFEKFRESYWPHFNTNLTKKLDPSRVFTEINTRIKGCLHFVQVGETILCSENYIQLSDKKWSSFGEDERMWIYEIFLDYEKMKMARGEFDLADLVNDLHCRFKHEKYEGDFMDFVYVDEVQDLTMKQLALLKHICKNVQEGFVFAGDTAQTIAKGVDFRFEDITSLFYKEFLHGDDRKQEKKMMSPVFQLTQNFRTHAGILNLAQSITELIYHFFPESIDKLKPETSLLCGEAPVLLDCDCHRDALSVIFQNEGNDSENVISFGSEQVILVRDDSVKDKLTKSIGRRAIVLTIFECKGLEFQDVLLYNFFGTSPLEEQWRIIYEYMDQNKLRPANQESLPTFSHSKHNIMCNELKQLYVAVTRTRQRLWICEDNGGFSSPMVRYWQEWNCIEVKKLDDSYAREMPVISTLEDWKHQGLKMFEVRNYKVAAQCFEHAGEGNLYTFARASELKEAAQNIRNLRSEKSVKMLEEAAELFKSISLRKKAAECYFDAEEYQKAGSLYYEESDIQQAAQCFTLARSFMKAAEICAEANLFNECLYACSEGKLFDLGLKYVRRWKRDLSELVQAEMNIDAIEQEFLQKCAFASHRHHDKEAMMKYVKEFNSLKSMQSFLKKLGCLDELLDLLVDFEKYIDAAKLARQLGNVIREADLLEKGRHYQDASLLYLASVLAGSLWADNGEGWPLKDFPSKQTLSLKAKAAAGKYMPHFHAIVCANIELLSCEKYGFLDMQQQLTLSRMNRNLMGQILSTRKLLDLLLPESDPPAHLKVKAPQEKVSVDTLFRHWKFYKDDVAKILSYLRSLYGNGPTKYSEYGKFCLEYLGVRKRSSDPDDQSYFLLYPDAKWVTCAHRRSDKKDSLNVTRLVNAAEKYWSAELFCVGIKVLETLESVLKSGSRRFLPVCNRRLVLVQIFDVAAFLFKETSLERDFVVKCIDISADEYFSSVFSLDNKMLRNKGSRSQTIFSRNIWKETIFRRFSSLTVSGEVEDVEKPTFARLIQMVVVLLGSGRRIHEQHKEILGMNGISLRWQPFLDDLIKGEGQVCHFLNALSDLYEAKSNRHHLVSPCCFVYLLDRLLVTISCTGGCLFATRSSVIEWLLHLDKNDNPEMYFLGSGESTYLVTSVFTFLAKTVHEILMNGQDMKEWAKISGSNLENSFRLLTLKLVILLIMICLNSELHLELLNKVLLRSDITARLPTEFKQVLIEKSGSSLQNVIAEALQRIDDPLVVIKNPKIVKNLYITPEASLNVFEMTKDEILEKICSESFPGKLDADIL
ncbi:hypothetical protein RND81_03G208100 [Saponaria officinalis]|uniref:UvrD-like helicase ATP-binding domain-containing protein n=1 Tax=Saponaria officinalis TaxID=3572 RepID=A0AAW1MA91_SAPOF